ncbi:hypothetical protein QUF50_05810 [Thiotrichales bacterium HSG1]|nr:hypothetical protein [Thiotrichales bacterium HSG1]
MHKQLFSTQRYLQKCDEVIPPQKKTRRRCEWVISRGLCYYKLFSLTDIPANRQSEVLQLKIKQWSPFQEYKSYQVWHNSRVQVWLWNKESYLEYGIKKATVLPENILHPCPTHDTVRLVDCLDGVEGQVWQVGLLQASRWWASIPSQKEWINFQRIHGLEINPELPTVVQNDFLPRPWGRNKVNFNSGFLQESILLMFGIIIFSVLLTWQTTSIAKWYYKTQQLQIQVDELSEQISPILTARNQAIADKKLTEKLLALNASPSQLELMKIINKQLSSNKKTRLIRWLYKMGRLDFTIETKQLDPTFYVKMFQPLFKDVKAKIGSKSNYVNISLRVD